MGESTTDLERLLAAFRADPQEASTKADLLASNDPNTSPVLASRLDAWLAEGAQATVCHALDVLRERGERSVAPSIAELSRRLQATSAEGEVMVLVHTLLALVRLGASEHEDLVKEALARPAVGSIQRGRLFEEVTDALVADADPSMVFDVLSTFLVPSDQRKYRRVAHAIAGARTLDARWWTTVVQWFESNDEVLRQYGAKALAVTDARERWPYLIDRGKADWLPAVLVSALGRQSGDDVAAVLVRHLDAPEVQAVAFAAVRLRAFGGELGERGLQTLERRVESPKVFAKLFDLAWVVKALREFDDARALPHARAALAAAKKYPSGGMVGKKKDIVACLDQLVAHLARKR